MKLKHILKTALNRSGCGAMEAEGAILIEGSKNNKGVKVKELKQEQREHNKAVKREKLALVCEGK